MSGHPTIGVIANAGKDLAGARLDELRAALADVGQADPPWFEVSKSRHAPDRVRALIHDHGVDRLLVWGGDGTVRRTIDTLLSDGCDHASIGILPAGTGNLLARNLGVPVDLAGAVDVAVHGQPSPIDVGVVRAGHRADASDPPAERQNDSVPTNDTRQHFAVMAGVGFDAALVDEADDGLKERFGRLGYVIAGIRHRDVGAARAQVCVDGDDWYEGPAKTVVVGNISRLIGGLPAFPDASPTDGRLDVGVVHVESGWDWMRLIGAAWFGRAERSPFAEITTGARVTVEFDRPLPWQVDGGDRDAADSFDISCLPSAVSICRPER